MRIRLGTDSDEMKAGLFAHTAIDILQRRATLCVPKEAVLSRNGRQMLFVVDADGKVKSREVKIGLMNDAEVEILDGIEPGDTVVVTNQDSCRLAEGRRQWAVPRGDHVQLGRYEWTFAS